MSSHGGSKSPPPNDLNETRPRVYSEEDEEIRVAKAMALAIQNNPNMTPDEIHQLTADLQKQSQLVAQQKVTAAKSPPTKIENEDAVAADLSSLMIPGPAKSNKEGQGMPTVASPTRTEPEAEKQSKRRSTIALNLHKAKGNMKDKADKAKGKIKGMVAGSKSFDDDSEESSLSPSRRSSVAKTPPPSRTFATRTSSIQTPPPPLEEIPQLQDEVTATESLDSATKKAPSVGDKKVRLTAILWKRRSGFGKLSSTNAWERRRVVLEGNKLSYYKTVVDTADEARAAHQDGSPNSKDAAPAAEEEEATTNAATKSSTASEGSQPASRRTSTWLESAAMNYEKAKDNISQIVSSDSNPVRGALDLVKERAIVAATTGHSGAPSPFCISIKVRDETKWKFCFDSHKEQMDWLAALTDVVVQASVDAYNASLLVAVDPGHESSLFDASPAPLEPKHDAAAGHRLWMLDKYTIRSETGLSEELGGDEGASDFESQVDEEEVRSRGLDIVDEASPDTNSEAKDAFVLRDKNLYIMTALMNTAMFYSHASSTGVNKFWSIVTFVNMVLWLLMQEEKNENSGNKNNQLSGSNSTRVNLVEGSLSKEKSQMLMKNKSRQKIAPSFKPIAGTTTMCIENPTDIPSNKDGHIFAGWCAPPGSNLLVRSHGYLSTKKKTPSPGELYKLSNVDIFESRNQFRDMSQRVKLPKVEFADDGATKTWHAPDVFVISVALPTDPPKMGRSTEDGGGYTITMYYTMKKETRDILKRVTSPDYDVSQEQVDDVQKSQVNAARLLNQWCRRAPTDPQFQARFKLVANSQNLKEIGMPNWIAKYNGKPVLIKRAGKTGFVYNHPELNAMEFDISFHPFPFLAKQALSYMKDNFFKKVLVTFGFVIEGRSDDELPECLIGLMQLCYPDPIHAIEAEDFFSGTSPKSF